MNNQKHYTTEDIKELDKRHMEGEQISFEDYARLHPEPITFREYLDLDPWVQRKLKSISFYFEILQEVGISLAQVVHLPARDLERLKWAWEERNSNMLARREFRKKLRHAGYELGRLIKAILCIPQ